MFVEIVEGVTISTNIIYLLYKQFTIRIFILPTLRIKYTNRPIALNDTYILWLLAAMCPNIH